MPHVVCEPCITCKSYDCVEVCPVPGGCFHDGPDMLYINPVKCIDCGYCALKCPVDAIYPHDEIPARWLGYVESNAEAAKLYPVVTEKPKAS